MLVLHPLGLKLSKSLFRRDRELFKRARDIFKSLDASLLGRISLMVDEIFHNYQFEEMELQLRLDMEKWKAKERTYLNGMESDIKNAYDRLAALATEYQKRGFHSSYQTVLSYMKGILPAKVEVKDQKLPQIKFGDASLRLDLVTDIVRRKTEGAVEEGALDFDMVEGLTSVIFQEVEHGGDNEDSSEFVLPQSPFLGSTENPVGGGNDLGSHSSNSKVDEESSIVSEAEKVKLRIGSGKVTGDFQKFLRDQLDQDMFPGNKIKTLSADHVKFVQGVMLGGVTKGHSLVWQKDKVMSYLGKGITDKEEKRRLEYSVLRIARTSHQRASTSAVALWGTRNSHIVKSLRRVANGRPCLSCTVLDGSEFPIEPGQILSLSDHPNGMCSWEYVIKSLEDMGYTLNDLPEAAKRRWTAIERSYPSKKDLFDKLLPEDQRKVFANNALFDLWKKEGIPIEALVVNRSGMFVPMSYREALSNLPNLLKAKEKITPFIKTVEDMEKEAGEWAAL